MGRLDLLKSGEWDLLAVAIASVIGIVGHVLDLIPESYVIGIITPPLFCVVKTFLQ